MTRASSYADNAFDLPCGNGAREAPWSIRMSSVTESVDVDAAYRNHAAVVLRRARHLLGNEQDARDVVQDVFEALVDANARFDDAGTLTAWLWSAATHRCLNRLRDRKTRARLVAAQGTPVVETAEAEGGEAVAVLRDALRRMPDEMAKVAVFYYLDQMNREEIARLLGRSVRHVGNLLALLPKHFNEAETRRQP
jgi:RNA polymerase sigma factor (sigma-70 family)